ncbi:class I SAM-dependent methyltransferase [Mycobacterium paragordonae]|uniref:Methyltransferase MycE N-terminal domain-containing protein n=2 Tax=Mycobacterium paragordonae TaxID=1389713 RepID=A0ABQ1CBF4_9MYCO|nr:class I SAM-dependent methyltransferase [Mycobacterium paragordonae]GFG81734.1 hypothetical protein MPRG_50100 [Mycobacterium paragordonae]
MGATVRELGMQRLAEVIALSNDTSPIERLLLAATLPEPEISARVADLGPDVVAEALLAEVACRAGLINGPTDGVVIQCDLGFGDSRLAYHFVLDGDGAHVEKGWYEQASAILRQDLVDMLREVFGPPGPYGATRELVNRWGMGAVVVGLRQLIGALSQRPKSLSDLAVRFGSDKWGFHWYTTHYEKYLEPYRELAVKVLEIGVGGYDAPDVGGESLRVWKHYFRRGLIYGLDVFAKTGIAESRLELIQGDQGDGRYLDAMAREFGPFDIVIDDGSHLNWHVIASFNALFPHVRDGGLYVIEDLQTSYWPAWGGDTDLQAQGTSMGLIKTLLDGLNHQEQIREGGHQPSSAELTVTGVHVHHNLALIEKGRNTEQGAPTGWRGPAADDGCGG